ncbi:hephaestin-like protein 1 [Chanos chanos]|uniref:ferroxidase n=1 Tax=Chanos chanos TaxID=29144 RepID=A0A6J2WXF1_CHACN|nr:hephaestin-like protein 1 [Chanos chanos]
MVAKRWILGLLTVYILVDRDEAVVRTYFIGITEESWDYAPSGHNRINGKPVAEDEHASVFLLQGPHRIGRVYKKAIYREYTNSSYSQEIPKPAWLGFLGPVLKAEVGDVIVVHLKNFASRRYSMHPHGVFYEKDSEGALYPDGTSGRLKQDDAVPPGETHTYTWTVTPEYAPTRGDANCLTWVYHSHHDAPRDINSGLIGALLTCKKGTLQSVSRLNHTELRRGDVDQDFILMFNVVDENQSWYLKENIQTFCSDPAGVDPDDEGFKESNKMHAINGYMYGNLPGIELCKNRTVAWHLFGMGNEVDIHSAYFHGQTVLHRGHRVDVLSLFAATFITADMVPKTNGIWLLNCQVNDHLQAGMQALFEVSSCGDEGESVLPLGGQVRQYFIAAEKIKWNYAPSGTDTQHNLSLTDSTSQSEVFFGRDGGRLGGEYVKVVYRLYSDDTFTTKKERTSAETHLGLLGPVLRAEVGDVLLVTFMNKADRNYSIQPHGLQYDKQFEGALYQDGTLSNGSQVQPGDKFTYRWLVKDGPSPSDPPCISYLYFSATDPVRDTNSGLIGPLLVCKRSALDSNNTQEGVVKEFVLLFSVTDENLSWYLDENIQTFGSNESDPENEDFMESNKMHAVNGYMYGNLPGLEMCVGDLVRWHILGLGTEVDMHGVHFQGNTFRTKGTTRDTLSLFPHTSTTISMQPDTAGVFEVSCRVSDHYVGGMRQQYTVRRCKAPNNSHTASSVVEYFISAEELEWDYSPDRSWELEKYNTTEENSPGSVFVGKGKKRVGSRYKKAVYRQYTDATFRIERERSTKEKHLEILGPIIRAEVGETILITFMNKASRAYSMYAHGVETTGSHPVPVMPGNVTQYKWNVPERSGPGLSDPNCISFAYYSDVDYVKDVASGLIGPIVICRNGVLDKARQRLDVDREFALLFLVFDENESWYLEDNIQTYLMDSDTLRRDNEFLESNRMHGINGRLYGNLHGLEMVEGEKVNFYLLGMGNEVDVHTVHLHAQTFTYKMDLEHRADVFDLFPGTFQTVEMVAEKEGTWLLHCHIADHIHAGMETTFTIKSRSVGIASNAVSALMQDVGILDILAVPLSLTLLGSALH